VRIALDSLGGDRAPEITIKGAQLALDEAPRRGVQNLSIVLVGDKKRIRSFLPATMPEGLELLHTVATKKSSNSPGEDEKSPIRTALRLHRQGEFDGVVSAGSTAAQIIASLIELEKCHGISRPAIGTFLPTVRGSSFLLDIGASLTATPHHLVQFAALGHVFVKETLGIAEPRIGLINVGSESTVGDRGVVEAHRLLLESGFNFQGFIEGREVPVGVADVLVTNGFIGNVLLKFAEGIPAFVRACLPDMGEEAIVAVSRKLDFHAHGGEPLLGVKGVSIICHGASSERAICQAVFRAVEIAKLQLHQKIEAFLVDRFATYFSQVKYLRSFRRSLRPTE